MTIIITLLKLFAIGLGISLGLFVAIGVCDALSLAKKYRQDGYNQAVTDIVENHVFRSKDGEYAHVIQMAINWTPLNMKGDKNETETR